MRPTGSVQKADAVRAPQSVLGFQQHTAARWGICDLNRNRRRRRRRRAQSDLVVTQDRSAVQRACAKGVIGPDPCVPATGTRDCFVFQPDQMKTTAVSEPRVRAKR